MKPDSPNSGSYPMKNRSASARTCAGKLVRSSASSTRGQARSVTHWARRARIARVQRYYWLRVGGIASAPAPETRSGAKARISYVMSMSSEKRRITRHAFESDMPPLKVRCPENETPKNDQSKSEN